MTKADESGAPMRFFKGQKKTEKACAPWSGSRFETEYESQNKQSEYTGVFKSINEDCRQKPLIPVSETREWMVGKPSDKMDLATTNTETYPKHPIQGKVPVVHRDDHTSTFINKQVNMKGSSTYMNSYGPQSATRPAAFRPGPPENITAIDLSQQFPKSVNYDTYRSYGKSEQAEARRAPIVLQPEFGNVGNSPTCSKDFATSYVDDFKQHDGFKRAKPLRPEENGIHYDLDSTHDMTTTHDRAYNMKGSGAKRTVPRNQPQGPYNPVSTMMSDFKVKTIDEPVMPFQPPVGLRKTFGDEKNGYVTGYENAFKAPDLSKITPVKNCKPAHQYKPPVVEMECASTTHSQFTGKTCPPAKSCKPCPQGREGNYQTEFKTEYNERYLQSNK